MMGPIGLDHIQLAAPPNCEQDARRFFGDLLGLEEIEKPEPLRHRGGLWFRCGPHQLHIGVEQPFSPALKAHPAFRVSDEDLDRFAERLQAAGAHAEWDDTLAGVRRFYTADPWGNRIEILACPVAPETRL
jgi:catechol 2,3-dioxygenase-like lactoylglutathione lyase family enzyme